MPGGRTLCCAAPRQPPSSRARRRAACERHLAPAGPGPSRSALPALPPPSPAQPLDLPRRHPVRAGLQLRGAQLQASCPALHWAAAGAGAGGYRSAAAPRLRPAGQAGSDGASRPALGPSSRTLLRTPAPVPLPSPPVRPALPGRLPPSIPAAATSSVSWRSAPPRGAAAGPTPGAPPAPSATARCARRKLPPCPRLLAPPLCTLATPDRMHTSLGGHGGAREAPPPPLSLDPSQRAPCAATPVLPAPHRHRRSLRLSHPPCRPATNR